MELRDVVDIDDYQRIILAVACSSCGTNETFGYYIPEDIRVKQYNLYAYCEECEQKTDWEEV